MAGGEFESEIETKIRTRSEKHIEAIMSEFDSDIPLLGSGNEFVPEAHHRHLVMLAKERGASNKRIAERLGINIVTLKKYFAPELEEGLDYLKEFLFDSAIISVHRARAGNAGFVGVQNRMNAYYNGITDKVSTDHTSSDGSMSPAPTILGVPKNELFQLHTDATQAAPSESPASPPTKSAEKPTKKPKVGKKVAKGRDKSDKKAKPAK